MLAHLVKRERNSIVFHHAGQYYTENLSMNQAADAFDRGLMDVFLLQYEETLGFHVGYDDIVLISALENKSAALTDLPANLQELHVMNSMCSELTIPETAHGTIRKISIIHSNLHRFPDIRHCVRLEFLQLQRSNISAFHLDYALPPALLYLDVCGNTIGSDPAIPFSHAACVGREFMFRGKFDDNHLHTELLPPEFTRKNSAMRQLMYAFVPVTRRAAGEDNVRHFVNYRPHVQAAVAGGVGGGRVPAPPAAPAPAQILGGSQSVHLSSINRSVVASIKALRAVAHNAEVEDQLAAFVASNGESNAAFRAWHGKGGSWLGCVGKRRLSAELRNFIAQQFALPTKHGPSQMRYVDLFALAWIVMTARPEYANWLERLETELADSVGMCFTGCFNRLVNTMVGSVDGVCVGISSREELQLAMTQIMKRFDDGAADDKDLPAVGKALRVAVKELEVVLGRFDNDDDAVDKEVWMDALLDNAPTTYCHFEDGTPYMITWDLKVRDEGERLQVGVLPPDRMRIEFFNEPIPVV
jgi:hypothetical protein